MQILFFTWCIKLLSIVKPVSSKTSTLMNITDKKYILNIFCLEWEGEGSGGGGSGKKGRRVTKLTEHIQKTERKEEKKRFFTVDRRTETVA